MLTGVDDLALSNLHPQIGNVPPFLRPVGNVLIVHWHATFKRGDLFCQREHHSLRWVVDSMYLLSPKQSLHYTHLSLELACEGMSMDVRGKN